MKNRTNLYNKIKNLITNHIVNNSKEYIIMIILFLIGIFIGVLFFNNMDENQLSEVSTYLENFITNLKSAENIDDITIIQEISKQNLIYVFIIWFFGTTVIGIPVVFGTIIFKGFSLGYTISSIINLLGFGKGIIFILLRFSVSKFNNNTLYYGYCCQWT